MPWLIVFDNADRNAQSHHDNLELLQKYWPSGKMGSVLITSQDKRVTYKFAKSYEELDRLTESDAVKLLYQESDIPQEQNPDPDALKIIKRLDCLAFGISQVAWIVRTKFLTFEQFLVMYEDNQRIFVDSEVVRGPGVRYVHRLSTVWDMQFRDLDSGTTDLMNIVSFLDPDKVEAAHLSKGLSKSSDESLTLRQNAKFPDYLGKLAGSPLVTWNKKERSIRMHRLVQETCRLRMGDERQKAFDRAYHMIFALWRQAPWHNRRQNELWTDQEAQIQHIDHLANIYLGYFQSCSSLKVSKTFAELLYQGGWYDNTTSRIFSM